MSHEEKRLRRIRAILLRRKADMRPEYFNAQWAKLQQAEAKLLRH